MEAVVCHLLYIDISTIYHTYRYNYIYLLSHLMLLCVCVCVCVKATGTKCGPSKGCLSPGKAPVEEMLFSYQAEHNSHTVH